MVLEQMENDADLLISKIDAALTIYRKNQVVIFGASSGGKEILYRLHLLGIEDILYFCDNDCDKWGTMFEGREVVSPKRLAEDNKKYNIVVQIGSCYEKEIAKQLENLGISNYIFYSEAVFRLGTLKSMSYIKDYRKFLSDMSCAYENDYLNNLYYYLLRDVTEVPVILCLPTKTGDYTLNATLGKNNYKYCNIWHRPYLLDGIFDDFCYEKIKIVTAVREPISQNLSIMYQNFGDGWELLDVEEYWSSCNPEKLFAIYLQKTGYLTEEFKKQHSYNLIQQFIPLFCTHIGNILECPFDKEAGWSVVTIGRYEIFIYQLEKMNQIYPYLFDWLGCEADSLINDNVGEDKWYARSYKEAQKKIKISREYFDKCYNEPYVKHFYSDEDIEKMKKRWETHIL